MIQVCPVVPSGVLFGTKSISVVPSGELVETNSVICFCCRLLYTTYCLGFVKSLVCYLSFLYSYYCVCKYCGKPSCFVQFRGCRLNKTTTLVNSIVFTPFCVSLSTDTL